MERGAEGVEFAEDHASELSPFFSYWGGGLLHFLFLVIGLGAGALGLRGVARSRLTRFFAPDSKRLLPKFYNGFLDKRDRRARKALEKVANEKGNFGQRR